MRTGTGGWFSGVTVSRHICYNNNYVYGVRPHRLCRMSQRWILRSDMRTDTGKSIEVCYMVNAALTTAGSGSNAAAETDCCHGESEAKEHTGETAAMS